MLDKLSGVDKNSEVVKISVVDLISVLAKISVQWLQIRRNFSSRHFFMVDEISVVDWFSVVDYFSKQNDRRKFSSRLIFLRHTKWYRRNFRCILFCGWPFFLLVFWPYHLKSFPFRIIGKITLLGNFPVDIEGFDIKW